MSSFSDRNKKKGGGLGKIFKYAAVGLLAFGGYQYWTPNNWKQDIGEKIDTVTHTRVLGAAFETVTLPYQTAPEAAKPAVEAAATAPAAAPLKMAGK